MNIVQQMNLSHNKKQAVIDDHAMFTKQATARHLPSLSENLERGGGLFAEPENV